MSKQLTVKITDEQERVLRLRMEETGLPKAVLVRQILNNALGTGGPPIERGYLEGIHRGYADAMAAIQSALHATQARGLEGLHEIEEMRDRTD